MHVVTTPMPPRLSRSGLFELHQLPVWKDNFAWILACTRTKAAAVVDSPSAAPVLAYAKEHELALGAIFNTHHHPDHIGINSELEAEGRLNDFRVVGGSLLKNSIPGVTELVDDGMFVELGENVGQVLLTEGHVNGHVSYLFDGLLMCGDTLFAGGCGYLFDGPPSKMHSSLNRLAELPGDTVVVCAHEYTEDNLRFAWSVEKTPQLAARIRETWRLRSSGKPTVPSTIAEERDTNPFLRWHSEMIVESLQEAGFSGLDLPVEVFAATRELKNRKLYVADSDHAMLAEVDEMLASLGGE